jgi:RND family efflux transporter MFP subunit
MAPEALMPPLKKATVTALAAGVFAALSVVTAAQNPAPAGKPVDLPPGETLQVPQLVLLEWFEKSEVAALREGVIKRMELQIGMPVREGGVIGQLHDEIAGLTVKKAEVAVASVAAEAKAKAQQDLALSVVAINKRLNQRIPYSVSKEEVAKAEAEVKVAGAMIDEAKEKRALDKAELELAKQTLKEHTIVAPFDGLIVERFKHPGESIRANEAVVSLANLSKLRAWAYVPLEYAYRVKEGMIVEIQPKLSEGGAPQPIERKKFRGKITFVDPKIQPVGEEAVRIHAEIENRDPEFQLKPGLKAQMTIYLDSDAGAAPVTAVGDRTGQPPLPR